MTLAAGTRVTPNVRLVRPLGQGGMGSLWVGYHDGLSCEVAVKFISADLLASQPGVGDRFKREAAAAARINSPHVVRMIDHGIMPDGVTPFIVMELLAGETLATRLAREGLVPPSDTVLIVKQVAKALTEAHARGITHRDLKGDNIFLSQSAGELWARVLDFGIAKAELPGYGQLTGTQMMLGTPEFMSPEQVVSPRGVDGRADLWALAVVAYQCLTGRMPFVGESVGGLMVAISNCTFTAPTALGVRLPVALDAWFARAFARDIGARFQTPRELADTFEAAVLGRQVASSPGVAPHVEQHTMLGSWAGADRRSAPAAASTVYGVPAHLAPAPPPLGTFGGAASSLHQGKRSPSRRAALIGVAVVAALGVAAAALLVRSGVEPDRDAGSTVSPVVASAAEAAAATVEPKPTAPAQAASPELATAARDTDDAPPAPSAKTAATTKKPAPPPKHASPGQAPPEPPAVQPPTNTPTEVEKKQKSEARTRRLGF